MPLVHEARIKIKISRSKRLLNKSLAEPANKYIPLT